jgi:hypothetical protein
MYLPSFWEFAGGKIICDNHKIVVTDLVGKVQEPIEREG